MNFGPQKRVDGHHPSNVYISQASKVQAPNKDADFEMRVRALNRVLRVRDRRLHTDEPEASLLPSVKHATCAVAGSSRKSDAGSSQNRHGTGPGAGSVLFRDTGDFGVVVVVCWVGRLVGVVSRCGLVGGDPGLVAASLRILRSLVMPPGRCQFALQSLGWMRVCGTAKSGVWVLKGDTRNLDDVGVAWERRSGCETAWATAVCVHAATDKEHFDKLIPPFLQRRLNCGAGSDPY